MSPPKITPTSYEWTTRFSDQKAIGLTVKEWCIQSQLLPNIVPTVISEISASPAPIVSKFGSN